MKIAYTKSPNTRGLMRERHRRDRAQTPTMRTRYPQLESLRLDFDFSDSGPFTPAPQVTVLHPPATAFFSFPCPYDDCDGEFDLTSPIDTMVRGGEKHCEGQLRCSGHRNGNKGKFSCTLTLAFSAEVNGA
jgi:hypothetical protein